MVWAIRPQWGEFLTAGRASGEIPGSLLALQVVQCEGQNALSWRVGVQCCFEADSRARDSLPALGNRA